jgi:hypothetical protein
MAKPIAVGFEKCSCILATEDCGCTEQKIPMVPSRFGAGAEEQR